MKLRNKTSRAKQRQEMLRELSTDEAARVTVRPGYSRASEAIDALQRIREGTYGFCAGCQLKIPAARLQIKPEAARCVSCQVEHERRSASGAGGWTDAAKRSA